ncbi:hypothetical protein L3C95_25850 [Chitinophaga filiformis]|uniref:hypothetical protein n=1 Tax=Chitinophaga filiformis TaxID=104663 RepID=UPI001F4103CB|nr:hypothetical protein [Chitinophaga filiformis]MCF6406346.1 hypothetical protein [Chitinophaga filiformis]
MKSVKSALLLAVLASAFASCSNDDDTNNEVKNGLEGNYTFVAMKADNHVELEYHYAANGDVIKTISTYDYDAKNIAGTITIDPTKFYSNKFKYTIETTLLGATYTNGVQTGYSNMPITMDVPEASSTSDYKLIGTDSIYLSGGFVTAPEMGDEPVEATPSGAKYKWAGDTLVITTEVRQLDTTVTGEPGMTVTEYTNNYAKVIMRFKKN